MQILVQAQIFGLFKIIPTVADSEIKKANELLSKKLTYAPLLSMEPLSSFPDQLAWWMKVSFHQVHRAASTLHIHDW